VTAGSVVAPSGVPSTVATEGTPAFRSTARIRADFVCRVSGLPANAIASLRPAGAVRLVRELMELDQELVTRKASLVDALHTAVGGEEDRTRRRALIRAKRDVFNLRAVPDLQLSELGLRPGVTQSLEAYRRLATRRDQVVGRIQARHALHAAQGREVFKEVLSDPDFRRGLLLSSPALHAALDTYLRGDSERPSGRERQVERGLLRYATRAAAKATPFGTLCAVIQGRFVTPAADGPVARFVGHPGRKRSFARLNKSLYGFLMEHLKGRAGVRRALPVELNPTLETTNGQYRFLTAIRGRELFQRIERNAVVEFVSAKLGNRGAVGMEQLIASLAADGRIDASEGEIAEYLDRLVEIGFLRFRPGIQEQDADWDLPLRALLVSVADEHATLAAALLEELRRLAEGYARADLEERSVSLDEMRRRINESLEAMQAGASLGRQLPIYEDATADARLELAVDPERSRAFRELIEYASITLPTAWPRSDQATMRRFYDTRYGQACDGVTLLRFYEDYYREHLKAHLERERKRRGPSSVPPDGAQAKHHDDGDYDLANPLGVDLIDRLRAARARVQELLERRCAEAADAEEIAVAAHDIAMALDVPRGPPVCRSLSAFVQLVPRPEDEPYIVLPGGRYLAGFGKYFSRFLYMLPGDFTHRTYRDNLDLTDAYLAEICGDAAFNANLHPQLLPWEVSYPTGEVGKGENQVPTAELDVHPDPADPNALCLRHRPTCTQVIPVDLGFLNPRRRPPLYQLLSQFGPPMNFAMPLPWPRQRPGAGSSETTRRSTEPRVAYRPRIVFGQRLVLARRSWFVPGVSFPRSEPGVDAATHFVAANRWRHRHRVPEQAYVRIFPGRGPRNAPSRDFVKPQFIDFTSPLLVSLFGRMPAGLRRYTAVIEECLPAEDALLRAGDDAYATELILQLDFPAHGTNRREPGE